jgi:hypothetical protein
MGYGDRKVAWTQPYFQGALDKELNGLRKAGEWVLKDKQEVCQANREDSGIPGRRTDASIIFL